ncbi:retrovirus-related pol polyprotein from transposon TNT 1-94 [Tanacetum coccineum]|uniref:Retrovirus-related pol polyprotein from transposon TNT 1-94 n=1 Tax=Tanacetum coccineum TaxID=301880 RepID=A0ABQ5BL77_9ASTR
MFQKGDDPIDAINHMMSFLTAVVTSRYPTTNNHLRNSSRGDKLLLLRVLQGLTLQEKVEAILENRGQLFTTTAKGKLLSGELSHYGSDALLRKKSSKPKLYVGDIIVQTNPIVISDLEETLTLVEESLSKMLLKHNDNKKALAITALKDELRKLKGKALVDNNVSNHLSDPELHQLNDYTTTKVPLRKSSALIIKHLNLSSTLVYSRKPRKSKTNVPVSNPKILQSVVQIILWYLDSGYSKHMTGDRSQLTNFVSKFLGTVKFKNDHVAKIMGYGDYQIGNVTISRVYYVEGLGHNLFSVGPFCDSNLEVAFRQHTCYIRNLEGVDLLTGSRGENLYTLYLGDMMASSPIRLLSKASQTKSWFWHCRLSYLNFGAINHLARHGHVRGLPKLKFEKDHLCSACALGKSMKKPHKPKYEDTKQEKLYLLHMDLCGPMRVTSVNGKRTDNGTEFINQTLREYYEKIGISHETSVARSPQQNGVVERRNRTLIKLTAMASEHSSSGPALHEMTPATISSGLVPNPHPSTPFVPPSRTDWDMLFQPLFDEFLNPSPSVDHPAPEVVAPEVIAPVLADSTGSPSSTIVDQDAPSPSNSQTTPETEPPVIPNDVEEDNHDIEVAHMGNDPKWTKDHPLENIIGELARPVSTRLQLHEQALFCYYDAFLTAVEPKTYKDALTQACWIEAMQEELNEFK